MRIPLMLAAVVVCAGCSGKEAAGLHRDGLLAPRVLVLFADPGGDGLQRTRAIDARRTAILEALPKGSFALRRAYGAIPGFAIEARPDALDALRALPDLVAIEPDEPGEATTLESAPLIKAPAARAQHAVNGTGVKVAVVDTGVNLAHSDLAGAVVAQQCFTMGDCKPNNTNTSGVANDLAGHGSNVAGIITADGMVAPLGIAPGASIIAVRVLDSNNAGFTSDWVAGLDWLYQNRATLGTRVVNMSLGTTALYTGNCDSAQALMKTAVANLRDAGVVVFASSGNDGSNDKLRSPACVSGVVSVGATYDVAVGRAPDAGTFQTRFGASFGACSDTNATPSTLTCFSNAGPELDLVAPGCFITSAYLGNQTDWFCGTSQAAPTVAAVAALMVHKKPSLTPDDIEQALKNTASSISDARTGRAYRFIDALAALNEVTSGGCAGKPNGTACNDGNACTTADACQGGACVGGPALTCTPNGCGRTGACNPVSGCVTNAVANGTACNDNDPCTTPDVCTNGVCGGTAKVCPAATGCLTASTCVAATGQCSAPTTRPDGTACFDGNSCTDGDTCTAGVCAGTPVACAATACRAAGACNPASGMCEGGAPKPDQTDCGGGNVCTAGQCATVIPLASETLGPPAAGGCSAAGGLPALALSLLTALAARRARRSARPDPTGPRDL